jgi:hypothetical protein
MWEMGRIHKAICQMSEMQENEVLQQGMSEKCLGIPQTLVCRCNSITAYTVDIKGWANPDLRSGNTQELQGCTTFLNI